MQPSNVSLVEELLPDELLCHILHMLPDDTVAIAARTCKRWFACSKRGPPPCRDLRYRLSAKRACSTVSLLQWGVQQQRLIPWNAKAFLDSTTITCNLAAEQGALDVILYARKRLCCPLNAIDCPVHAAKGGHLNVLKWAILEEKCYRHPNCCLEAARNGHLHVLKWLREEAQCEWDLSACIEAVEKEAKLSEKEKNEVLDWIIEND
ncbi:Ankyrin repeat domain containing protein [Balamuthia mandrillaris]